MFGFVIIELEVFNQKILEEYKKLAPDIIKAFNGKLIVRGGQKIALEGNWNPERLIIIQFPSFETAKAWYDSEMYKEASIYRNKAAKTRMIIVEGV